MFSYARSIAFESEEGTEEFHFEAKKKGQALSSFFRRFKDEHIVAFDCFLITKIKDMITTHKTIIFNDIQRILKN